MRVKGGYKSTRRHKKVLKQVKGFRMTKSKLYKVGHESYMHSKQYSRRDRRKRASQMRSTWIVRLNGVLTEDGISYSKFINLLKKNNILLNRKMLSEIAINHPNTFSLILNSVK